MEERLPTFTRHTRDDGSWCVTVDFWPDRIDMSDAALARADPELIERTHNPETDADEVTIRCANGEATYRIAAHDRILGVYRAVAVRRQWTGAAACASAVPP